MTSVARVLVSSAVIFFEALNDLLAIVECEKPDDTVYICEEEENIKLSRII